MRMKSIGLGSVAIAAMLLAGGPVFGQSAYGNGPQVSTPAERAQTQQLNAQSTNGTDQSPATLNGEAGDQSTPSAQSPSQQQYEQQSEKYDQDQQRYEDQRAQYQAQRQQYVHDLRRYDLARYEWRDYPQVYTYNYDSERLRPLYLLAEPAHQLAQLPVEGPSGRFIGKVRNVETAPDGRPLRVEVALNRVVSVWVRPSHFRFDASDRVVFTDLSRDDLWNMPGATVESEVYRD